MIRTSGFWPSSRLSLTSAAALATAALLSAASSVNSSTMRVEGAMVTFDVGTNISAVSVHGKSTNANGTIRAHKDGARLTVDEVATTLPVESINTGMGLRDQHMRKYIFTTSDGRVPELKFMGANVDCPIDAECQFAGKLSIRGIEKPLTVSLKLRRAGAGYHAIGEGTVKLSDYGIERPSQFGVKCADEVRIRFEVDGREVVESTAASAAARPEAGK